MDDASVFVIDPEYWKAAQLRTMSTKKLPKTGDNQKRVIVGELTLEARAEKANAMIKITPAA
jgi:hypothetical protein